MPSFVSVLGKWFAAKEYAINPNAKQGENPVYEGPDRAAMEELRLANVEHLGQDYHLNPDLIRQSRELGYKTVDEYLYEMYGFDAKAAKEKAEKQLHATVVTHKDPDRKKGVKELGGGFDKARQGKDRYGDFGTPDELK